MNKRYLLTSPGILAMITAGVLIIFIVAVIVSLATSTTQTDDASPAEQASSTRLSAQEQAYPVGEPQRFFQPIQEQKATGSLVVTSSTPKVWVQLDPPDHTHAEAPLDEDHIATDTVPPQYPPFRFDNVPVGKHRLIAASEEDYMAQDIEVMIKEGEVTRIHIELQPM